MTRLGPVLASNLSINSSILLCLVDITRALRTDHPFLDGWLR